MFPSRATRARAEIRIPWTLMQSTPSRRLKEKGHRVRVMGVLSAGVRICNEIAMHAKAQASNRMAKASKFSGKGKSKENKEKSKGKSKGTKSASQGGKGVHKGKTSLVSEAWKTRNQRQARKFRNLHRHTPWTLPGTMVGSVTNGTITGVSMSGMMTGVLLDGTKVGSKLMTLPQAHFRLEFWM